MMTPTVLAVDDEPTALNIIRTLLRTENYQVITADNGQDAWKLLKKSPEKYDAVILDRMMPKMNGMSVLMKMRSHKSLKMVPVIFQTSMADEENILEGLRAGVDYYLTKPLNKEILLATVKTATSVYTTYKSLWEHIRKREDALMLMKKGMFEFRTMDEARILATLLASVCPVPDRAALGLWELLINALEHGNLGISYEEKSRLIEKDKWCDEIKWRMSVPENASKKIVVNFEHSDSEIRFMIRDQGKGFEWQSFMELNPERAFAPNGRGIHLAKSLSFDRLEYVGTGNEVTASIYKAQRNI